MISSLFNAYLAFQVVAAVAVICLILLSPWMKRLDAGSKLKLHYSCLLLVLLSPLLFLFWKSKPLFEPMVKVWSSTAPAPFTTVPVKPVVAGVLSVGEHASHGADYIFLFALGLCVGSLWFGMVRLVCGQICLSRIIGRAFVLKSFRFAKVMVSEDCKIPFSYRSLRYSYVVIPSYLMNEAVNFRLAVLHELQHHRQGDTLWTYPRLLLGAIGVMNPFIYLWNRWIDEVQEFACDEALVGRQNLHARDYARCLIQVAETAWVQETVPVGATGMILLGQGQLLNRRIQTMFQERKFHGRLAWLAPLALIGAVVTTTAFAAKGMVRDRRVTMAQAQALAKTTKSGIPIRVNEDVLRWLNHFVGTPEGRESAREALRRMDLYRGMIEVKIREYHVPIELLAVPFIETGYKNLPETNRQGVGAGIWSFIPSTARRFGLRVDEVVDERLNEEKLTEAAMRYLLGNKLLFDDWELALISYNAGENFVRAELDRLNVKNAWEVTARGNFKRETREYLPKLNAAILIMNSPHLIQ